MRLANLDYLRTTAVKQASIHTPSQVRSKTLNLQVLFPGLTQSDCDDNNTPSGRYPLLLVHRADSGKQRQYIH